MINVGVVGASGWAAVSHLPALAGLTEFKVSAVATTRQESADQVATAHGVPHAFADAKALTAHPDVDLVVVSVKVPDHAQVITSALESGKHVLSEWPLGTDAEQARELTAAATDAGVLHAVNMQGYHSPDARFVADLLAGGGIGTVESVVMTAPGAPLGGSRLPRELAFSLDPAAGVSILTIMAGHFLATLELIAGRLTEVSAASLPRLHDRVLVDGAEQTVANELPSHVLLRGVLDSGAEAVVTLHGGNGAPDGFLLKFVGSQGTLTAAAARPGMHLHWTDWDIRLDGEPLAVPEAHRTVPAGVPSGPAVRIAALYQEIAQAMAEGRQPHPDFETALRHHRLLASIERSAASGLPQTI